ncbi:protein SUPPRESSOR OF GENE SILENCING 3 homolog [Morus notabilis]|uniref:protein SUPPRESSOR OF GENE SILENCING 3 homolog n=1 Tax=Morus notabilis TaxID=981085 RepID=UPI000CED314B|nr:protein SUPPRESSOR OF GENE SILENCING 3 homolog [Morus notabilis]XP_024017794.1 protein SUPPRESSOR OF GENE SILENCING 3 homolog [Morus notabilis]
MAGESTHPDSKASSHKPSSSSAVSHRKSRWQQPTSAAAAASSNPPVSADPKVSKPKATSSPKPGPTTRSPAQLPKPGPTPAAGPIPALGLPPPPSPSYGFHMLERRTIVLADGSVRSYFALPPDYQDFPPPAARFFPGGPVSPVGPNRHQDYWNSLGLDGPAKRKFPDEEDTDQRRYGEDSRASKYTRTVGGFDNGNNNNNNNVGLRQGSGSGGGDYNPGHKHLDVDQIELKKAFLRFVKILNENAKERKIYFENGKRLQCVACGRSSKDFPDTPSLITHSYNYDNDDLRVDHLGLHKALCVLMGWNYSRPPDNSRAYQFLSADEAAANQDDLILWPPMVIIHNTLTGKNKEGRMEGLGNKLMDARIRDLGFHGGKSKSLYGRDGHLGITLIKFSSDQAGLKEAICLAEHFDQDNRGRRAWARLQPLTIGTKDDENNPHLMQFDERTREKKRIFYGYLGTATDLDKVDFETKKKVVIESWREYMASK